MMKVKKNNNISLVEDVEGKIIYSSQRITGFILRLLVRSLL